MDCMCLLLFLIAGAEAVQFNLTFSMTGTFDAALADQNSEAFLSKSTQITSQVASQYNTIFGTSEAQMKVIQFRNGSIITDSVLTLNNMQIKFTIGYMKDIFLNGVYNFSYDPNSLIITKNPVLEDIQQFNLTFSMTGTFDAALADQNSEVFLSKSTQITSQIAKLFVTFIGNFDSAKIIQFRNGSIVTEVLLSFSPSNPDLDVVTVKFLFSASTFNFAYDRTSVIVTQISASNTGTTTSLPNTTVLINTTTPTSLPNTTVLINTTTPTSLPNTTVLINTTTPTSLPNTTVLINTTTPTSPPSTTVLYITTPTSLPSSTTFTTTAGLSIAAVFTLTFSIIETFVPALADRNSPEFLLKSTNIINQVTPLYKKDFKNFISLGILSFRNGSVWTDTIFYFNDTNVNTDQVKSTFLNGIRNLTFSVNPGSVTVSLIYVNSMPPVTANSLSMISLALLSLLLSVLLL